MRIPFPSAEFFRALQERLESAPDSTEHLDPSEAYCGLDVGGRLFVLEFEGRACSAVVAGGNELDLDFVVAGDDGVWQQALEAADDPDSTLPALVEKGELEIRSPDDGGLEMARETLPFLQVFLAQARGLELEFD